jgi:uncharacterized repeat protein (TIGR03803 family)
MALFEFTSWLRQAFPRSNRTNEGTVQWKKTQPLILEQLEDRLVLSGIITLATFNSANGAYPSSLIEDSSGNLFGTTNNLFYGDATVFELAAGSSSVTTLASFKVTNGAYPNSLIEDGSGNLFGTTNNLISNGTVFELVTGSSSVTTLVSFNGVNGFDPTSLIEDRSGNLFGTTASGGANDDGTVFEVAAGSSSITTLVSFNSTNADPDTLIEDSSGNLFGTTVSGKVFELTSGNSDVTTLASFNGTNGSDPISLIEDSSGNLFGATNVGGANDGGTVFEVTAGSSSITTLVSFNGTKGFYPNSLIEDSSGNLFGTTEYGGANDSYDDGTVFEVTAGSRSITTLVSFNGANGDIPDNLIEDSSGNLFGTTISDSENGGTVFEVVNSAQPTLTTTASPAITLGTTAPTLSDTADLQGGHNETGNIVFTLSGPGGFSYTQTDPVSGNGTYSASTPLPTTHTVAGSYTWSASYSGDDNNLPATDNGDNETTVVSPAQPTLTTTASPDITLDTTAPTLSDSADLKGGYYETGTIVFTLSGPGDFSYTQTDPVSGNGTYSAMTTLPSTGTVVGSYTWSASYSGDDNNLTATDDGTNETTVVSAANPTLTTVPDPSAITLGTTAPTLSDSAVLSHGYNETGTINFTLTAPDGSIVDTEMVPMVNGDGTYTTPIGYTLPSTGSVTGTYQWNASYDSGDPNNNSVPEIPAELVTVSTAPLTLTPATIPPGFVGTEYTQRITASGGIPDVNVDYAITSGSIPAGINFDNNGDELDISGTPTASGFVDFDVTATDSVGTTVTQSYILSVSAQPQVGYTPEQIRTAYGINSIPTFTGGAVADGSGQTIAIVDAYNDPNIFQDLDTFDKQFGLTSSGPTLYAEYGASASFLTVVNQNGQSSPLPGTDRTGNWESEEALDVEWAHAIAPGAKIILVEANSQGTADEDAAVQTAAGLPGVSVVSTSFGIPETASETSRDSAFTTPSGHQGVTFLAAAGDEGSPGVYPAFSPNVVAVGGTALTINANDSYGGEIAWSDSGGGISQYEAEPAYQESVQSTGYRTTPDVAFDADPNTGVYYYNSFNGSPAALVTAGTSLGAPCWAALIAIVNQGRTLAGNPTLNGASQTLPALYSLPAADFHDITSGSNGGFTAKAGYDEVTGLGTPVANLLVPALVAYGTPPPVNQPPVINPISPQTAATDGNSTVSFMVTATAQTASGTPLALTFTLGSAAPLGAKIDAQTGLFMWTPSEWNGIVPGVYTLTVSASETNDPQLVSTATFSVTVGPSSTNQGSGATAQDNINMRTAVAAGVDNSQEYYIDLLDADYLKYVNRLPTQAELTSFWYPNLPIPGQASAGADFTDQEIEAYFIGSPEYIQDNGGTDSAWIAGMYVSILGRPAAPGEITDWLNQKQAYLNSGLSVGDADIAVAKGIVASNASESILVGADYTRYLGRSGSSTEIAYWVNLFQTGYTNEQVIAGFVGSQEFFQNHGSNIVDWLFADYKATLNRLPDLTGFNYWENQL